VGAVAVRHLRIFQFIDVVARAGSIRKAAEQLALTSSALNRRIQDFEEELGTPIFERLPRGVRLNAAGELILRHARTQLADVEKVRSQIADLGGQRRGHISVACSQAVAYDFLATQIAAYRAEFPAVTFSVEVGSHDAAQAALADFTVDIVLVFEPVIQADLQVLYVLDEPLYAVAARGHPALEKPEPRLRECLRHPIALLRKSYGGRQLLEAAISRKGLPLKPVLESNSFELLRRYVLHEKVITFQTRIGAPFAENDDLVSRPVDLRDVAPGRLVLGQLRGRSLPVASAKFANSLAQALDNLRKTTG
jgi:DNA-binding transcriptional LysR family regulator